MDSQQLEILRALVKAQYGQQNANRDEWADWLYENHVLWVADKTAEHCERFGANTDIAVAAALVHDIADSVMERENTIHEEKSLEIGRKLCKDAGFSEDDITIIIDDIALKHSCLGGVTPESEEGKLMAAADAASHYLTNFYPLAFSLTELGSLEDRVEWAKKKIERDFREKIFHEEIREEIRPKYEAWKTALKFN